MVKTKHHNSFLYALQINQSYTFYGCPTFHFPLAAPSTVKKVNTYLQWFTVTSTLLHCNVYGKYLKNVHFLRVSQFPLYVFAV